MRGAGPRAASESRRRSRSPSFGESASLALWMNSISFLRPRVAAHEKYLSELHADLQPLAPVEAFGVAALPRHLERDRLVAARAGSRVPNACVRHPPVLHLDEDLHYVLAARGWNTFVPSPAYHPRRGRHGRRLPRLVFGLLIRVGRL